MVRLKFANSMLLHFFASQFVIQPLALEFLQVLLLPEFFFYFSLLAQAFRFSLLLFQLMEEFSLFPTTALLVSFIFDAGSLLLTPMKFFLGA